MWTVLTYVYYFFLEISFHVLPLQILTFYFLVDWMVCKAIVWPAVLTPSPQARLVEAVDQIQMIIIRLIFLFSNIIIIKLGTTPDKEPPSVVSVMDHSTQSLKLNFPISNQYHTSTQIFAPSTTSMRKRKVRKSCPNLLVSQATTGEI